MMAAKHTTVKIAIICEGKTEKAFKPVLLAFLKTKLAERKMPKLDFKSANGTITQKELPKLVGLCLKSSDAVIALTDVQTDSKSGAHVFETAEDAKQKMRQWVGDEKRIYPHAAQYEFEAWLLPYWDRIQKLTGTTKAKPNGKPEEINHGNPPSKRIAAVFPKGYGKITDGFKILDKQDLSLAIEVCSELKAFVNTILKLCGSESS